MNPTLEKAWQRLSVASPEVQKRMADTIIMTIDNDGRDEYQEYVDAQLEKGLADIKAGRTTPAEEFFPAFEARMKAKYGAV